jgi:polysaccharide biosynthesis protein PelF
MLDIVMFCEGTYPYVAGGVSSWIHSLVQSMPELQFGLVYLSPARSAERRLKFQVPDNVREIHEVYLYDVVPVRGPSRPTPAAWEAVEQFFLGLLDGRVRGFEKLVPFLSGPVPALSLHDLAFSQQSWEILVRLYQQRASGFSITDFFWNWRFICFPILQLLHAPVPAAKAYHTVTTGWSGLLATLAKLRSGRPLLLTEHGIYTHERRIEIVKANWIYVEQAGSRVSDFGILKTMWINLFQALGQLCYEHSDRIFTLYEGNRRMEIAGGADPRKIEILPNGVKLDLYVRPPSVERFSHFAIGFVGRVVPIKAVKHFIQACRIVRETLPDAVAYVIGPTEEDEEYFGECKALVQTLGVEDCVRFLGPQNVREWYPKLDVLVLTSVSEGQPLVILEGFCYEVPCVATDVGACSELIYGREGEDREIGPAGFVTPVGAANETAAALIRMAQNPELRLQMGRAGKQRVERFYDFRELLESYRNIYKEACLGGNRV